MWISEFGFIDFLLLTTSSLSLCSVQGVFVGSQLWHFPWRPVHRHRLWGQESHSLRGYLLNSEWLKKSKLQIRGRSHGSLPQHWLYRALVAWKAKRHSTCTFVVLVMFVNKKKKKKESEVKRRKVTSLEKRKKTLILMLWECWLVYSCATVGFLQRTFCFCFLFFGPFFLKTKWNLCSEQEIRKKKIFF